jgi:hypothetical protein
MMNKLSQTAAKGRLTKFGFDGELKAPHSSNQHVTVSYTEISDGHSGF